MEHRMSGGVCGLLDKLTPRVRSQTEKGQPSTLNWLAKAEPVGRNQGKSLELNLAAHRPGGGWGESQSHSVIWFYVFGKL